MIIVLVEHCVPFELIVIRLIVVPLHDLIMHLPIVKYLFARPISPIYG